MRSIRKCVLFGILAAGLGSGLALAQNTLLVGVDLDTDPSTGCDIVVNDAGIVNQVVPGFELRFRIEVSTGMPPVVQSLIREECSNGSFVLGGSDNAPGFSFQSNAGVTGADIVDGLLPLSNIAPASSDGVQARGTTFIGISERFDLVRTLFFSLANSGAEDVVAPGGQVSEPVLAGEGPTRVPTLSQWALMLLAALLAGAAAWMLRRRPAGLAALFLALCLTATGPVQAFVDLADKAMFPDPIGDSTTGDPSADIAKASAQLTDEGIWVAFDIVDLENSSPVLNLDTDNSGGISPDFAATFTEGGGPVAITDDVSVNDPDGTTLSSATATIANPQDGASEVLAATACAGLTVTPGLNSLSISGVQPLATYAACLASATYDNTAGAPNLSPPRIVNFVINDGNGGSDTATSTVTLVAPTQGVINIVKDTVPDDPQDFDFTTTGGLSPASFSLDDDADGALSNTQSFTANFGTYTVTETAVPGFDLTIACIDPDGQTTTAGDTATIDLDATETVTCTFTNTKRGSINIVKDTVPDDPQDFDFTSDIPGGPANFSLDDDADGTLSNTETFSNVVPGSYTVSEAAVAGFDVSLACVDPDGGSMTAGPTATIDLDAGETVTCTFTNTKRGTINIVKDTVPDDPQDFDFTSDIPGGPANFSLDDDADGTLSNTETFSNVVPGSYTVSEAAVAGFDVSLACVDPDGGSMTGGPTATIDLDAGETVTCTFTNTKRGTINIVKDTVPDDPQDFDFTSDIPGGPANFSLDDDADSTLSNTETFSNVTPGSYTVSEAAVAGFDLTIACVDPDGGTTTAGSTATIDLDEGESVTCTFTNTKRGSINIVKDTVPDDPQDFDFTSDIPGGPANFSLDDDADGTLSNTETFSNVVPGSYTVSETAVAGFDLSLACVDPDGGSMTAGPTATIDLDAGETVTCTFTNTKRGSINIVKDTVPDDPQDFDFTSDIPGGPANFSLDDDADGTLSNTETFSNVVPGSYTVSETPVAGFDLSLACVDPDGGTTTMSSTATIDLDAGETVTCTFTNTKRGTINIVKDTVPDDPQDFDFTSDIPGGPANFSLDDDADGTLSNTETFSNVVPGSYTVSESSPPATFFLSDLSCVDPDGGSMTGGATATIDLDAGETITCTYTNTATAPPSAVADPNGGLPTDSTPSNDAMAAGTDNAYHTAINTNLAVPDGAGDLLDNDSLGTPPASMTGFGPTASPTMFTPGGGTQANATDQGGSLDVSANGSFTYTPPSATFTGLDNFAYRLTNSAGTSDGTVTVAVGLRPGAVNDTVTLGATGNVAMQSDRAGVQLNGMTGQNLLSNDAGDQISLTAIAATSTNGGDVSSVAGNHFRYNPLAGFDGADSFTYTIDNGFSQPSMGTVNLTVGDMIWFIDNSLGSNGTGRLGDPFNALASFEAINGGATMQGGDVVDPEAGDCIFLHTGSGDYTGGVTLENSQILAGQGASNATTLDAVCGITAAAGSDARPALMGSGSRPRIVNAAGNAVAVAMNNTIRGLNLGDTPAANSRISGTSVGTLSISEVLMGSAGGIISITTGGTLNATLDSATSTSSSGVAAINLNGLSGTSSFTVSNPGAGTDTSISGAAQGISIQGSGSATFSFGESSISSSGDGIDLGASTTNPAASFTFDSLGITATAGDGFVANTSGTINVTGASNSINATGGAATDIDGTALNITLSSVTTTNSPDHGIDLTSVSGTQFTVTGNVTIDMAAGSNEGINVVSSTLTNLGVGSGAAVAVNDRRATGIFLDTVSNTAAFGATTIPNPNSAGGYGIRMEDSSGAVTFDSATISATNQTVATADAGGDGIPDNDGDGDAVFLKNNSGSFTLNGGTLSSLATDGIDVRSSGNLTFSGLTIEDIGTGSANPATIPDAGLWARNLSGTNLLLNTVIRRAQSDNFDEHIRIKNASTNIPELRLNNVDISNTTAGSVGDIRGANGFLFEATGSMDATVIVENGSDATGIRLVAWDFLIGNGAGGSGTINVVVDASEMDPNGLTVFSGGAVVIGVANDLQIGIQDSYAVNYNFVNNFIHDVQLGLTAAGVISNNSTGSATVTGRIVGNQITDIRGRRGVNLIAQSSLSGYSLTIDDNDINDLAEETVMGANLFAAEALGMQVIGSVNGAELRVLNNRLGTVTPVGNGNLQEGVFLQTGQTATANIIMFGNTVVGGNSSSEAVECDIEDTSNIRLSFNSNTLTAEPDDAVEEVFVADTEDPGSTLCVDLDNNVATIATQEYELDENGVGAITLEDVATDNTGALNIDPGVTTGGADCARPSGVILASTGRISQLAAVNTAFQALMVTVKDDEGSPASGVTVTFTAPGAGASGTFPSGNTCMTDAMGQCSVPFTANATAGAYQVTAASGGFEGAIFYLRNTP